MRTSTLSFAGMVKISGGSAALQENTLERLKEAGVVVQAHSEWKDPHFYLLSNVDLDLFKPMKEAKVKAWEAVRENVETQPEAAERYRRTAYAAGDAIKISLKNATEFQVAEGASNLPNDVFQKVKDALEK